MILIDSVFALEVGAAARSILSNAIMYCGRDGSIVAYKISEGVARTGPSGFDKGLFDISSSA